jgi:hypothetical protein
VWVNPRRMRAGDGSAALKWTLSARFRPIHHPLPDCSPTRKRLHFNRPPAQTAFPVAGLERDPPFFLYTYIKRMHGCCSGRGRAKAHWAKERGPS